MEDRFKKVDQIGRLLLQYNLSSVMNLELVVSNLVCRLKAAKIYIWYSDERDHCQLVWYEFSNQDRDPQP